MDIDSEIHEYLRRHLKLNIKDGDYGFEVSLVLDGEVLDTIVLPEYEEIVTRTEDDY